MIQIVPMKYKEYPECMFAMIATFMPSEEGDDLRRAAGKVVFRHEDEKGRTYRNGLQSKYAIYGDKKYKISNFMLKESTLIKAINEQDIYLSLFEDEFKALNSGTLNVTECKSVEEINRLYDVLGYFGLDSLIEILHQHVYMLEFFRIPEGMSLDKQAYFLESRKIQFSSSNFPESLFERYLNMINWTWFCKNTHISEAFFERYLNMVDWTSLSGNTNISEDFLMKYIEKVYGPTLCLNARMSEEFFERHLDGIYGSWICRNTNLSEAFFERHLDIVDWLQLSLNSNMSEAFFERHMQTANWHALSLNTNMSEEFFERYIHMVDWTYLSKNTNMSEAFFERHLDKVKWSFLSRNSNMSEAFFERHLDKVNWMYVSGNKNVSEKFFIRYFKKLLDKFQLIYNSNVSIEFLLATIPLSAFGDKCNLQLYRLDWSQSIKKYRNDCWMKVKMM